MLTTIMLLVKNFFKKHGATLLVVVAIAATASYLFKRQSDSFIDQVKKIQDNHALEIQKIEQARAEERRQHEENQRKLEESLAAIQKSYDDAKRNLVEKKRVKTDEIVAEANGDPVILAQKLNKVTGFRIVLP